MHLLRARLEVGSLAGDVGPDLSSLTPPSGCSPDSLCSPAGSGASLHLDVPIWCHRSVPHRGAQHSHQVWKLCYCTLSFPSASSLPPKAPPGFTKLSQPKQAGKYLFPTTETVWSRVCSWEALARSPGTTLGLCRCPAVSPRSRGFGATEAVPREKWHSPRVWGPC